jgi:uncharacterized phage protein (TIGR01671 family)
MTFLDHLWLCGEYNSLCFTRKEWEEKWDVWPAEMDENIEHYDIMQYTGLHDKNDKEIYEKDIVAAMVDFGPAGEYLRIYPVTFGPHGVNIEKWTYNENILPEVIGNIYENPELLTKDKNEN